MKLKKTLAIILVMFSALSLSVPASAVYGDVDGGGALWIDDVTHWIDDMLSGQTTIMDDINGDLKVDMKDLTILIDLLLTGELTFDLYYPPVPDSALVITANGVSFAMMPVKGGPHYYYRNDETGEINTQYSVALSDFYMGMTEVTADLWKAVMGDYPTYSMRYDYKPNLPMCCLSYFKCKEFIAKLNELTGLEFRLPTYDQWKYAALGGQLSHNYRYAGSDDLDEVAWYDGNRPELFERYVQRYPDFSYIMPAGMKKPNELGLYDMTGNMMEVIEISMPGWGEYCEPVTPEEYDNGTGHSTTHIIGGGIFMETRYCDCLYPFVVIYPLETPYKYTRSSGLRLLLPASSLNR